MRALLRALSFQRTAALAAGLALCGASATRGAAVPRRARLANDAVDFGPLILGPPIAHCDQAPMLRKSGELADPEAVAQSWFEDGPDMAQAMAGARARNRAKVATYLLQSVIARHRDKWADLLLRTALWMREAPLELNLCWRELAIVAKALADGRDMAEIGLMCDIAQRTLADRRR
jgi:hypothetical protein